MEATDSECIHAAQGDNEKNSEDAGYMNIKYHELMHFESSTPMSNVIDHPSPQDFVPVVSPRVCDDEIKAEIKDSVDFGAKLPTNGDQEQNTDIQEAFIQSQQGGLTR